MPLPWTDSFEHTVKETWEEMMPRCGCQLLLASEGPYVQCLGKVGHTGAHQFTHGGYQWEYAGTNQPDAFDATPDAGDTPTGFEDIYVPDTRGMMNHEGGPLVIKDGVLWLHGECSGADQRNVWFCVITGRHDTHYEREWAPVARRTRKSKLCGMTWEVACSAVTHSTDTPLLAQVRQVLLEAKYHDARGFVLAEGNGEDGFVQAKTVEYGRVRQYLERLAERGVGGYGDADVEVVTDVDERKIDL